MTTRTNERHACLKCQTMTAAPSRTCRKCRKAARIVKAKEAEKARRGPDAERIHGRQNPRAMNYKNPYYVPAPRVRKEPRPVYMRSFAWWLTDVFGGKRI